jgi:hypothetical protein
MTTSHRVYSDLFQLSDFVQQTSVSHAKNLIIDAMREYFKKDTFYRFETDAFGFPLTPDLTDLPPDIEEKRTTRIFIGDLYRFEKRYWPAVVVRYSSGRTYHVSFNQENTIQYRTDMVIDGYGSVSYVKVPTHKIIAGAWEQDFEVIIAAESIPDREELTDIVSSFFIAKIRQEMYESGLFIKNVSIGAEREEEWGNEKIYLQSVTLNTFSEWRREIPINANSLIEAINFCFNMGVFGRPGLEFTTSVTQDDVFTQN